MWSTGSASARTNVVGHKCQCVTHTSFRESFWATQCVVLLLPHITGKFSMEISTLNTTWKKLFLVFVWQVPLCPEAWLATGALPCKASHHVEQILAFGVTLYLWGRVPPRLSCSSCSRWESSGRLGTPAQALPQDMCLWPHILALPLLCSASMTSQALTKKGSCFLPLWLYTVDFLLQLAQRHLEQ